MKRTISEQKALKLLNISDFRYLTKDKIVEFSSLLYRMDPEVAKKALEQIPEYVKLASEMVRTYKEVIDKMFEANAADTKAFYDACNGILSTLAAQLQNADIPFYRGTEVGALAEGKQITPELFITEQHYTELCEATGAPQIGDLLMPSICPDGRIWVVNTDAPFYFKDGRVLWVHAIDSNYNPIFLLYTLKDRIMTDYSSIASGTTFAELKIFALKKCRIFDVPLEQQNQFAAFIEQTDKSKFSLKNSRKVADFAVKYIWESLCRGTPT